MNVGARRPRSQLIFVKIVVTDFLDFKNISLEVQHLFYVYLFYLFIRCDKIFNLE